MSAPEWTDNLQQAHDEIAHVDLDDEDLSVLDANGVSIADYQSMFAEAFMQYRNDPNNELEPHERAALRQEWFDLIDAMGYSSDDFDWDLWREWMGYQ